MENKCSKNCPGCAGSVKEKKNCPEWITVGIIIEMNRDLKYLKNTLLNAMVEDFRKDLLHTEDDDEHEETAEMKHYSDEVKNSNDGFFT